VNNLNFIDQFNQVIDEQIGLKPKTAQNISFVDPQAEFALEVVSILVELDFSEEIKPQTGLQEKWISQTCHHIPHRSRNIRISPRAIWVSSLLIIFSLMIVFHQPVFAQVGRMFGYFYMPDVGFVLMDSARVLSQPVSQEHDGRVVTVTKGLATPDSTVLWVSFSDFAEPLEGAWLEIDSGEIIEISSWHYSPTRTGTKTVRADFSGLPLDVQQSTLKLLAGWHLPLIWVNAAVVEETEYPEGLDTEPGEEPEIFYPVCDENEYVRVCVVAASADDDGTYLLLEIEYINDLISKNEVESFLEGNYLRDSLILRDADGEIIKPRFNFPPSTRQKDNLVEITFRRLAASNNDVTLTVQSVLAYIELDQSITVDLGSNPLPGDKIKINTDIEVMGYTLHFGQGRIIGDGEDFLRLVLNAKPLDIVNEIVPIFLKMESNSDLLFGSGNLSGNKDIFLDLITPDRKISGEIIIKIIGAYVQIEDPLNIQFPVSKITAIPTSVVEADPDTFLPVQPTLLPELPLDAFQYSHRSLNANDLLYTVSKGENTDLFVYSVISGHSEWFATLPGSVYDIYIHSDRQGIDYFTGVAFDPITLGYEGKKIRMYTLRFDDPAPHLLYKFPIVSDQFGGIWIRPIWSFDGRYMVFQSTALNTKPGFQYSEFSWIDMACREEGNCSAQVIEVPENFDLHILSFSPNTYRLLATGSNKDGGLYVLNFDPDNLPNQFHQIPNSPSQYSDAVWVSDTQILVFCGRENDSSFCFIDLLSGEIRYSRPIKKHIYRYRTIPSLDMIIATIINPELRKGSLEIQLFDMDGNAGPALASYIGIEDLILPPSEDYIVFVDGNGSDLKIIDIMTHQIYTIYSSDDPGSTIWAGWVN